jgi:hypothetical protein
MKTNLVLIFILLLGIALILGGVALWHLSSTVEFSRTDAPSAPVSQGQ